MKESYVKSLANHNGLESCATARKDGGEALTEVRAGWVLSREMKKVWSADLLGVKGRQQLAHRSGEMRWYSARSQTPSMYGFNLRENREILRLPGGNRPSGRAMKSKDTRWQ
jgi:hypothetical protein